MKVQGKSDNFAARCYIVSLPRQSEPVAALAFRPDHALQGNEVVLSDLPAEGCNDIFPAGSVERSVPSLVGKRPPVSQSPTMPVLAKVGLFFGQGAHLSQYAKDFSEA